MSSQCVLPVCSLSVSYQCVLPVCISGGAGSGPQPAASPQCVLRILCIRWYAELHVPSAALIYGCSCKSANALLAERSHGEGSFARIFNAPLTKRLDKTGKPLYLLLFRQWEALCGGLGSRKTFLVPNHSTRPAAENRLCAKSSNIQYLWQIVHHQNVTESRATATFYKNLSICPQNLSSKRWLLVTSFT